MDRLKNRYKKWDGYVVSYADIRIRKVNFTVTCEPNLFIKIPRPSLVGLGYMDEATKHFRGVSLKSQPYFIMLEDDIIVDLEITGTQKDFTLMSLFRFRALHKTRIETFVAYFDYDDDINLTSTNLKPEAQDNKIHEFKPNLDALLNKVEILE